MNGRSFGYVIMMSHKETWMERGKREKFGLKGSEVSD